MASGLIGQNKTDSMNKTLPISFYHEVFEKLGYTKVLAEKRIHINKNYAKGLTIVTERNWTEVLQVLVAGSRGEGMAISLGSDIDMIFVQRAVKCFETNNSDAKIASEIATFKIDLSNSPEGYAKLYLLSLKTKSELHGENNYQRVLRLVNEALIEENGCKYLRNDCKFVSAIEYGAKGFKREGWLSNQYIFSETNGPALPIRIPLPLMSIYLNVDYVPAFPCFYQSPLDAWRIRVRPHKWPTEETIRAVMEAEMFVVPAGEPGSDDVLTWRISFTQAEQHLIHSFSDTQIKVYAALKMLAKHELKPKCSAITSYLMKNILFWVFETTAGVCMEDDFNSTILKAIAFLKDHVRQDCLENYMIPSRNMLKNRITKTEKTDLLSCLDLMIKEGPRILLRCPMVREMFNLDELEVDARLIFRELWDEILLGIQSLPPDDFNIIEHKLHLAQSSEELMKVVTNHVFPFIRKSNPFTYFKRLGSMDDPEICSHLKKGIKDNWLMWTGYII